MSNASQALAGLIKAALLGDPAAKAYLANTEGRLPSWLTDQIDAATAETARATEKMVAMGIAKQVDLPPRQYPEWVIDGISVTMAKWMTGEMDTCIHAPSPNRPQPVMAVAWRPNLILCMKCVHLTQLPRGSVSDRICDGCGHVCGGSNAGDPIHPGQVHIGMMRYVFGACTECQLLAVTS